MKKPIFVIEDTDDYEEPSSLLEDEDDPSRCTADEEKNRRPLLEPHRQRPARSALLLWLSCCEKRPTANGCVSM